MLVRGKRFDELDLAWNLEAGHRRSAVGDDVVSGDVVAFSGDDQGEWGLSPLLRGDSDDGGFEDGWMVIEDVFDLDRGDVLSAGDDHVLGPVDDVDVAVLVDGGHVSGVEPAVDDHLVGLFLLLPVTTQDDVGAGDDFADLFVVPSDFAAGIADDPDLDADHVVSGADLGPEVTIFVGAEVWLDL